MLYLGINVSHNASTALMLDGEIIVGVSVLKILQKFH